MKEWREYISENPGGHWLVLGDKNEQVKSCELLSENKGEAVMQITKEPGEYISVNIISASKEIDSVSGKTTLEKDFYVQLECIKDGWSCISKCTYKAEEALNIAKLFLGQSKNMAIKMWKLKNLGPEGNRIDL